MTLSPRIEAEMRREVPAVQRIVTHIESEEQEIEHPVALDRDRLLVHDLRNLATPAAGDSGHSRRDRGCSMAIAWR